MAKFVCPPRFIAMVSQFHDGMQAPVRSDREYSEPFPVTNGVKRGCVMTPTLFNMMFSVMLTNAVMLVSLSGTALMTSNLTYEGCKPNLRYRRIY